MKNFTTKEQWLEYEVEKCNEAIHTLIGMLKDSMEARHIKREWVDLKDFEVRSIQANAQSIEWAILMAQSTLKEKNSA